MVKPQAANRSITLFALGYFLALVAVGTTATVTSYRSAWEGAELESVRVAGLAADSILHTITATDVILKRNQQREEELLAQGKSLADTDREKMIDDVSSLPEKGGLLVIDETGTLIKSTYQDPPPARDYLGHEYNYRDRDYFIAHKSGKEYYLGAMEIGKSTGMDRWTLSRRINGPDGSFRGVMLAALQTGALRNLFDAASLGNNSAFAVMRADGRLVMRHPMQEKYVGQTATSPEFLAAVASHATSGVYDNESHLDGQRRIHGWRKVEEADIYVLVGIPTELVWAKWRSDTLTYAGALVATLIPLAFLVKVARNTVKAEERTRADLEAAVKERTRDLQHALRTAEQANKSKSRFLAAASHDLRQPLQAIRLFTDVLKGSPATCSNPAVDHLENAVQVCEGLLHALLQISALDAGIVKMSVATVPLQSLLDQVENTFGNTARAAGLRFTVMPCSLTVRTDPALLLQILLNLVGNSIKYTPKGGVLVGCSRRGDKVAVQVWDTGLGIPQNKMEDIFDDFVQLNNDERDRSRGIGLGLPIVRRTAALLGHQIVVSSQPGRGSVFSVIVLRERRTLHRRPLPRQTAQGEPSLAEPAGETEHRPDRVHPHA